MLLRMLYTLILPGSLTALLAITLFGQTPETKPLGQEFPVTLEQTIKAGKTPVGTKVEAKLAAGTLVNGKVIPRDAIFSGEVVESQGKNGNEPSRLSVYLHSVTWKNGSAEMRIYVTPWFYPVEAQAGPDLQYGPGQSPTRDYNYGPGEYPNPNSRSYKPYPTTDTGKDSGAPATSSSVTSKNRIAMKGVESEQVSGERVVLVSKKSNIALSRLTTYVAAAASLRSAK